MFTIDDVSPFKCVGGEAVLMTDEERQAIADEWNARLPTPEQIAAAAAAQSKAAKDAADALEAKEDAIVSTVAGFSMTQVDEYVDLHFGTLTEPQKDFLKAVGKVCVIGARNL